MIGMTTTTASKTDSNQVNNRKYHDTEKREKNDFFLNCVQLCRAKTVSAAAETREGEAARPLRDRGGRGG
jgi:hypothetical protein